MTKAKSKRKPASRANDSKTKARNCARPTTAREAVQLKSVTKPAANQQPQVASQPTARYQSKKAHIIGMLRAPGGVTIEAMARATIGNPFGPRLPRRVWQRARPRSRLADARMGASTVLRSQRRGGVERCGKHDRLRGRQPNCRWTTRSRVCAISISMACGRAGRAPSGTSRLLICPAICCLPFLPTGSRPMSWAISIRLQRDC